MAFPLEIWNRIATDKHPELDPPYFRGTPED